MSAIPSILAFGGNVEANGATWSDGMTHINVGGSHEENPNEGVQLGVDNEGTPNLVEEGEVIYNDYVFSNRLTVPVIKKKKDLSQEEKSKLFKGGVGTWIQSRQDLNTPKSRRRSAFC